MPSELLVSSAGGQTWAAIRERGASVELRVEDDDPAPSVGCVVKGRVVNVLPGIQSAFIDIGLDRNGFLHVADLAPEPGGPAPDGPTARPKPAGVPIQDRLRAGDSLLVQVTRDEIRSKGSRLTCQLSLPGRFVVHLPLATDRAVSRRIVDPAERERLESIVARLPGPNGFILRTAGRGAAESAFQEDARRLLRTWSAIREQATRASAPAVVHHDLPLQLRLLRDSPSEGFERVVVDEVGLLEEARRYLERLDPGLASRIELHEGPRTLRETYGLDREIDRVLRPRVWLRSGGYLVIEQTEALVSIDVNTGRFVGRHDFDETVLRTNLEAADEIARQLRLRDLGGIIVVDFIDMVREPHRKTVIERLDAALSRDRARTKIVGLSELGLLQLTRKRTRPGVGASITRSCPTCAGRGRVKTAAAVAAEALAEVRRLLPALRDRPLTVRVNPLAGRATSEALRNDPALGADTQPGAIRVEEDASLSPERFEVVLD